LFMEIAGFALVGFLRLTRRLERLSRHGWLKIRRLHEQDRSPAGHLPEFDWPVGGLLLCRRAC